MWVLGIRTQAPCLQDKFFLALCVYVCFPETESHRVALASLDNILVDQDGLELAEIPLPLLSPKANATTPVTLSSRKEILSQP